MALCRQQYTCKIASRDVVWERWSHQKDEAELTGSGVSGHKGKEEEPM